MGVQNDAPLARYVWPRLAGVFQLACDLACAATDMLLRLLKSPELSKSMQFDYRLVCRASTGPAPRREAAPAPRPAS